jgi:thiosulfate dehydrogenase [quinone] large subunit
MNLPSKGRSRIPAWVPVLTPKSFTLTEMTEKHETTVGNKLGLTYGALLLRIWLSVRAIQTGVEKFAGTSVSEKAVTVDGAVNNYGLTAASSAKQYALANYHGVPQGLMDKFKVEPLMMSFGLKAYDLILGPALILLGVTILLGIASRTSLFLLGLLYVSLTWGLILINQNDGVAWLGTHMVLVSLALMLAENNRFTLTKKW